ncbi:MAG: cellulase family glycosylhydrolase [Bacteroidota bacterium]
MKTFIKSTLTILALSALVACGGEQKTEKKQEKIVHGQWSVEKAQEWGKQQPWYIGANFNPSTAINQLETWQAESFDVETIEKELGWAQEIGMNTMRVYLHHLAWEQDKEGFKKRMSQFLDIAKKHEIKPFFVFFDDCWNPVYEAGTQPAPKPGVHNSGWVQDPGDLYYKDSIITDKVLETYVKDVLTTFKDDERILMWDLYNEPGNNKKGDESLPLVKKAFQWGWDIRPSQPLTVGIWTPGLHNLNKFQVENSDIVTFHNYENPESMQGAVDSLLKLNRPVICTEYMARRNNSLFTNVLPILAKNNVGAVNWGLVDGKSNTKYAWDEPLADGSEPELWFHEVFRKDGTPYKQEEVDLIKKLSSEKNAK